MRYLCVRDLVWVSNCATGETLSFDYEKLEACVAGQYDYGAVRGLKADAALFLAELLRLRPFEHGNRRSALLAAGTFLVANGAHLRECSADIAEQIVQCEDAKLRAGDVVAALAGDIGETPREDPRPMRAIMLEVSRALSAVIEALAECDGPAGN